MPLEKTTKKAERRRVVIITADTDHQGRLPQDDEHLAGRVPFGHRTGKTQKFK